MAWRETPENQALKQAAAGWSALVLVPGLLFVFGLIWLVMPPYQPPPQSWANGTYTNPCCAPLLLKDGVLSSGGMTARYVVSDDKFGHRIEVAQGISVRQGRVTLGGTLAFVHFNRDSMAAPALKAAESLHLTDPDSSLDYVFVKRK